MDSDFILMDTDEKGNDFYNDSILPMHPGISFNLWSTNFNTSFAVAVVYPDLLLTVKADSDTLFYGKFSDENI